MFRLALRSRSLTPSLPNYGVPCALRGLIHSTRKVMSFVFINILALFPAFSSSLAVPRDFPESSSFGTGYFLHDPVPRPSVGDVKKLEFWIYFMHFSTQLGLVLSSF